MPDISSLVIYVDIIQFVLGGAWRSGHREQTYCYSGAAGGTYDNSPGRFPWEFPLATPKLANSISNQTWP